MADHDDARLIREHLDLLHRLNVELAEAVLRVADETGTPPMELAQLSLGGGGLHSILQPLLHKQQQEMMRQHSEAQRRASGDDR